MEHDNEFRITSKYSSHLCQIVVFIKYTSTKTNNVCTSSIPLKQNVKTMCLVLRISCYQSNITLSISNGFQ